MRLLFLSDRMVGGASAYSKVTRQICFRLAAKGHKVAHIPMGMANRMGYWSENNVLICPSGMNPWGEDVAVSEYLRFKADMLITIKEPWMFNQIYRAPINFVPQAIIDHAPVSAMITTRLHTAFRVIAVSRHAQRELRNENIDNVHYIPFGGVDTRIYRPLNDREACRKLFFLEPDYFVVGLVARNQARKTIDRNLRGYKRFLEWNPDVAKKSCMLLWTNVMPGEGESDFTEPSSASHASVYLVPEMVDLGLDQIVHWPDKSLVLGGLGDWDPTGGHDMVKLYNSLDVLLLCSGGEGFGMPLIEAQACGVPVITTDYAAGAELVGSGMTVPYYDYMVTNTPGTRYALADIDKIAEALTKIYNANRTRLSTKAVKFAERYDWERVIDDYWQPFLADAENDIKPLLTKGGATHW